MRKIRDLNNGGASADFRCKKARNHGGCGSSVKVYYLPSNSAKFVFWHLTRNRFGVMSATWVRIPPSPPQKSSNHAGLLDFSFFVIVPKITRFWAVLSNILERTAFCFISRFFLRFAPICCQNLLLREGAFRSPSPAPRRVSNCNPDGRRCSP